MVFGASGCGIGLIPSR